MAKESSINRNKKRVKLNLKFSLKLEFSLKFSLELARFSCALRAQLNIVKCKLNFKLNSKL